MHVNSHAHVFNLRALLTARTLEIVRDRLVREIEPKFLAERVGALIEDFVTGLGTIDEEALLRDFLEEIKAETEVEKLIDKLGFVPEPLRPLVDDELDELLLRGLRRAADALVGLFRRESDDDIASKSIFNVIDLLRLVTRPRIGDVAARLMSQIGPEDAAVLLALDITKDDGDGDVFDVQTGDTAALLTRYPGRVLPFYGLNPLRSNAAARLEAALRTGYVGVKIYPSTGWDPEHADMEAVYALCAQQGLPVLVHCNQGGFYDREESVAFADPDRYEPILARFPGLKICFAHFGGGGGLASDPIPADHWATKILALMERHEGVYTDLSSHSAPMKNEATREVYFRNLKDLLRREPSRSRILFGTDFWLMRVRLTEARHWRFFRDNLTELQFQRIAGDNPAAFIGLPDAAGAGASLAVGALADRVVEAPRLDGPVAPWLLPLIEQRHGPAVRSRLEEVSARFGPAPGLIVTGWRQRLAQLVDRALGEQTALRLDGEVTLLDTAFDGLPIALSGAGALDVALINDADVVDPDGVIGVVPAVGAGAALVLRPLVPFTDDRAWLKYRLEGELRLQAGGQLGALGLSLEAGKTVVFADYRVHDRGTTLPSAVRGDLSWPRFATSLGDVLRLEEGEALSFAARGTLEVGARASWSDVLTGGLSSLGRAIGAVEPLAVRLDLAASVSARLSFTDDFRVVIARRRDGFAVGLVKLRARGAELTARIGATLQFDDPEAVERILGQALEQRLGAALGRVQGVLAKERESDLGPMQKNLLEKLEGRLGAAGLDAVRERVETLRADAAEAIRKIARARLTAGFRYEYSRLETDTALLEATVSEDVMVELHHQLVAGDLTGLLFLAGPDQPSDGVGAGVEIERYVVENRVEKRRAWGFTLGSAIAGGDVVESAFVSQEALLPDGGRRRRIAFRGAREYQGRWPGIKGRSEWRWRVDFRAEMPTFSAAPEPRTFEFDYGLALLFEWDFRRLTAKKLVPCLDAAALWGVIGDDEAAIAAAGKRFADEGLIDRPVSLRLQLLLDDRALMAILPEAADFDRAGVGRALGAAMPYSDDPLRGSPAMRRRAYGDLWRAVLDDPRTALPAEAIRDFAETARRTLRNAFQGQPRLVGQAEQERDSSDRWRQRMETFGGMLVVNNSPRDEWLRLHQGLDKLAEAERKAMPGVHHDAVEDMFTLMSPCWGRSHWVRALGALLLDHARRLGARSLVEAGASAAVDLDGGRREVLVLGG